MSPIWVLTNIQPQPVLGGPASQRTWSPNRDRVPDMQQVHPVGETSKTVVWGSPLYSQEGHKLTSSSTCDQTAALVSCQYCLFCCVNWNAVKLGAWLASPLLGLNSLKMSPPSYLRCCKPSTHCRQSLSVRPLSRQLRSKVRGLLCFVSEG